jgi:hypothetical protein
MDAHSFVIEYGRCITQRLFQIFIFQGRVFCQQCGSVRIDRKQFQNAANRDPHSSDARFTNAFARLNRDPIERHMPSLAHV